MFLKRKLEKAWQNPKRDTMERIEIMQMTRTGVERDLKFYLAFSGLELDELKKDEIILDVGAGAANFAKEAGQKGVSVVALDNTYRLPEGRLMLKDEKFFEKVQRIMKGKKQEIPLALAILAEALPFRDEQFDRLFYIYSAFNYSMSAKQAKKIFDEGLRVLRPEGKMHIYPIFRDSKSGDFSLNGNNEEGTISREFFDYVSSIESAGIIETEKLYPEVKTLYRDIAGEQEQKKYYMKVEKLRR